jgi:hypothetical protein
MYGSFISEHSMEFLLLQEGTTDMERNVLKWEFLLIQTLLFDFLLLFYLIFLCILVIIPQPFQTNW